MKLKLTAAAIITTLAISGCSSSSNSDTESGSFTHDLTNLQKLLVTNADIAFATYSDSVTTAEALQTALTTFAGDPSAINLAAAKTAWLVAREPYGQSEVYRFRDSPIDDADGPEGSINAWPLGEALIDYVDITDPSDFSDGQVATGTALTPHQVTEVTSPATGADEADNIIGNATVTIDATLLAKTEAGDGADVIAGYHAIEFLLWGQDLNNTGNVTTGTDRESAVKTHDASNVATGGERPLTDFNLDSDGTCTTGTAHTAAADDVPCQRRHDFLTVLAQQLIDDLTAVRDEWATDGTYRATFTTVADIDAAKPKFLEILTGMGTMSIGELAGERMQIAFAANSQEDEHSCFSDNTHRDIWLDAEGVANAYNGSYAGYDGTLDGTDDVTTNAVDGYGIADYLADIGATELATDVAAAFADTEVNYTAIDTLARAGTPVDVQIMPVNVNVDAAMSKTILSLNAQTTLIAKIATDLELGTAPFTDDPGTACDTTNPLEECP